LALSSAILLQAINEKARSSLGKDPAAKPIILQSGSI